MNSAKIKQNNDTNLYPICSVCIQIWNNVAQGSSLRPETLCCSLGCLSAPEETKSPIFLPQKPIKLPTSRFEGDRPTNEIQLSAFYACFNSSILLFSSHRKKSSLLSFRSCVSLDLIMIIPYLQTISSLSPPTLFTITPALGKWQTYGLKNRIAKLEY